MESVRAREGEIVWTWLEDEVSVQLALGVDTAATEVVCARPNVL